MADSFVYSDKLLDLLSNLIIAIVSGLIFFFLGKRSERKTKKRDEFDVAKKEFVAAFDDALKRLNFPEDSTSRIISETMANHKIAYDKFVPILRKIKGSSTEREFNVVWNNYYKERNGKAFPSAYNSVSKSDMIKIIKSVADFVNNL